VLDNIKLGLVYINKETKELIYKVEEILESKAIKGKIHYLVY
jgi:hypothetical protein